MPRQGKARNSPVGSGVFAAALRTVGKGAPKYATENSEHREVSTVDDGFARTQLLLPKIKAPNVNVSTNNNS